MQVMWSFCTTCSTLLDTTILYCHTLTFGYLWKPKFIREQICRAGKTVSEMGLSYLLSRVPKWTCFSKQDYGVQMRSHDTPGMADETVRVLQHFGHVQLLL